MAIALLGTGWTARQRATLTTAGLDIVSAERAELRLVLGAHPPARPPRAPWLWIAPRAADPADAATAVLAGAYDVIANDRELAQIVGRRLAELAAHVDPPAPPAGYVARSAAARQVLADLDHAAR